MHQCSFCIDHHEAVVFVTYSAYLPYLDNFDQHDHHAFVQLCTIYTLPLALALLRPDCDRWLALKAAHIEVSQLAWQTILLSR
jgi:hypothetical protein